MLGSLNTTSFPCFWKWTKRWRWFHTIFFYCMVVFGPILNVLSYFIGRQRHPNFFFFICALIQKQLTHQQTSRLRKCWLWKMLADDAIYMIIRKIIDVEDSHKQENGIYKIPVRGAVWTVLLISLQQHIGITPWMSQIHYFSQTRRIGSRWVNW